MTRRRDRRRFGPGPYVLGLRIYELDASGLAPSGYDELEAVRFTRGFLEAPERFLRAVLDDD